MDDPGDQARADVADLLDQQLSPLGRHAIAALAPRPGDTVLDVGCGAGQTVLQLADLVGPDGHVTGVDIAPLVLAVARRRAAGRREVDVIDGDAATLALPDRSLDGVFSRFGVIAFRDPVAAFANLRRMMKPTGRLAFVCWRSLDENEVDFLPLRAAGLEDRFDPTPFSFADSGTIRTTLARAGFREVAIEAHDDRISCGDLETTMAVLLRVGALGRILRDHPDLRPAADARVRAVLAARGPRATVMLNAATWVVTARP